MTSSNADLLPSPVSSYLDIVFPDPPSDRPYVVLNMVMSADGKAVVGSSEAPLSSPVDKLVLQALRTHADAILNGAGTARVTGVNPNIQDARLRERRTARGKIHAPLQVLLSHTGNFPDEARFLRRRNFELLIVLEDAAGETTIQRLRAAGCTVETMPEGRPSLPALLSRLRRNHGVQLLLLEGGPNLNASFFHAGLIDEFFVTVGPHVAAGRDVLTPVEGEPFDADSMPVLQLLSALPNKETSEAYLRWRVQHRANLHALP